MLIARRTRGGISTALLRDVEGCGWFPMPHWTSGCPFKNESESTLEESESRYTPPAVGQGITSETAKMVEKFVGTWKMVSSENFDDYMKAIGGRESAVLVTLLVANWELTVIYAIIFLNIYIYI